MLKQALTLLALLLVCKVEARVQGIPSITEKLYIGSYGALTQEDRMALDRRNFPIRVYISPLVESDYLPGSRREQRTIPLLLPRSTYLNLRQAVLDWSRILILQSQSQEGYTVALKQSTDESDLTVLEKLGLFTFVSTRQQADLPIIAVEAPSIGVSGDILGIFDPRAEYSLGKIRISQKIKRRTILEGAPTITQERFAGDFFMRSVMIHELGHALALKHVVPFTDPTFDNSLDKCNIMYPTEFPCESKLPQCKSEPNSPSRCRGVQTKQIQKIEEQLQMGPDKSLRGGFDEVMGYAQGVDQKVKLALPTLPTSGSLKLTVSAQGELQQVEIVSSFGTQEVDDQVMAVVKKLAPFGALPSSYTQSELTFALAYVGTPCLTGYQNEIQRLVLKDFTVKPKDPIKVELKLNGAGELLGYKILTSSGDKAADRKFLRAIESQTPFPILTKAHGKEELTFLLTNTVPPGPGIEACAEPDWEGYVEKYSARITKNLSSLTVEKLIRMMLDFDVNRKGEISNLRILPSEGSGSETLDQAVLKAIQSASPLDPLPISFDGTKVEVRYRVVIEPAALTAR